MPGGARVALVDPERLAEKAKTDQAKFQNPDWTARGERRATVGLETLQTLWFNTGTLCNITCRNCYIESSPSNDRLVYLTADEVRAFLDEIAQDDLGTVEIGFTGGEPFMNPDIIPMLDAALARGFEVLVLTNGLQPMLRPRLKKGLLGLRAAYGNCLTVRVSLDHYTRQLHEAERGPRTFAKSLEAIDWLSREGFKTAIAGRTCWSEPESDMRAGYAALIAERGWRIDTEDPHALVLLPEMDGSIDVPEISVGCWQILGKKPGDLMCAKSRMIVKRKGEDRPTVVPCTLLPYERAFGMGATLREAAVADGGMFDEGRVKLCHPHCAKFCALGGGSCS
ncbi:radical SAM protein [Hyphomicrobium sp. CS1BSMeth3]|uniref:radical SAM protein n=1 Tax=Hyphomicrobium sp. CS1BSMeth3 TaxID=1892844 RepID=UPI000930CC8E|nr:radical SAM protein [Hyphomicrobium sp. CS1BSMeth3]